MSNSQSRFEHPLPAQVLALLLTALLGLGSYLFSQAFSPGIYGFFLLLVLAIAALLISAPLVKRSNGDRKRSRAHWFICVGAGCLLLFLLPAGLFQWTREDKGCTLAIYASADAKNIPQKLTINRGFPHWLSFMDQSLTLERDPNHNKFSATDLRCGPWYVSPEPKSEFQEIGLIEIPSSEPRKFSKKYSFPKRRCKLKLTTYDAFGRPLEGASIQITPTPQDFDRQQRTPEIVSLEVGSYEISFSLAGYEPSEPISRSCFPDAEEEVEIKLSQKSTESISLNENDPTAPNKRGLKEGQEIETPEQPITVTDKYFEEPSLNAPESRPAEQTNRPAQKEDIEAPLDEPDEEALATVRKTKLNQMSTLAFKLHSNGQTKEAIAQLDAFRREYPGTQEAQEAADFIQDILADQGGQL